jgi:hypothetical protein
VWCSREEEKSAVARALRSGDTCSARKAFLIPPTRSVALPISFPSQKRVLPPSSFNIDSMASTAPGHVIRVGGYR